MQLEGFQEVTPLLHCLIYALVHRREVVYIGQSRRPLSRLDAHAVGRSRVGLKSSVSRFRFDQVFIHPCMLAELDELETKMIALYRPKHNQRKLPPASAAELELLVAGVLASQAAITRTEVRIERRF